MASVRSKRRPAAAADRLLNRELSFLDYDARVLELAADPALPLLERVKFCSIFSSMLDEFFMVRVAGLTGQAAAGVTVRSPDGRTPRQALAEARERVLELSALQSRIWTQGARPGARRGGCRRRPRRATWTPPRRRSCTSRWEGEVFPVLTPLAVGPGQPFPYISALSISLAVFVRDPETGEERFARVKVPEGLPRFLPVGAAGKLVPLEQVLVHFLPALFPGMEILERSLFRVTRDADLEVSDEADDLLEAVELELRRARFGELTRVEVSASMSEAMRRRLQIGLRAADDLVYPVTGTLDLADAMELTALDRPDLKEEAWVPVARPPLAGVGRGGAVRRDPLRRRARPPPVRLVRGELRVVPRRERHRSERDRDQVDRVPDLRRHAARAGADRPPPNAASRASASSRSRPAATSGGTSSGRARSSRRASTSSTGSRP